MIEVAHAYAERRRREDARRRRRQHQIIEARLQQLMHTASKHAKGSDMESRVSQQHVEKEEGKTDETKLSEQ